MIRHRRRAGVIAAVVLVLLGTAACSTTPQTDATPTPHLTGPTSIVRLGDLANTESVAGTLGYGRPIGVRSARSGTVTALPPVGRTLGRGTVMLRIDDRPIPTFFGSTPLFRTLGSKVVEGADVRMVARNLVALGFLHVPHPELMTSGPLLQTAVRAWQSALGVRATGVITPGDVQVLAGPSRVQSLTAQVGDRTGDTILSVTALTKVVTITATPQAAGSVKQGARVSVSLPDGEQVAGRISSIGAATGASVASDGDADGSLGITVTITDQQSLHAYDSTPVTVGFVTASRAHVLSVPIAALLALREGGYALQTPEGALLPVKTGLFTDDDVEVSGVGIAAGVKVMTAQ